MAVWLSLPRSPAGQIIEVPDATTDRPPHPLATPQAEVAEVAADPGDRPTRRLPQRRHTMPRRQMVPGETALVTDVVYGWTTDTDPEDRW